MAWLEGWQYRRKITVTNNSGTDVTDYQVEIVLDSNNFDFSKANADGSDIRFTEDDGQTLLSYWIESWDSTNEEARVWVKVPSILDGSSTDIYMYYGNSSAESLSNGDDTFILFDDFEGDSLDENKWKKGIVRGDINLQDSICEFSAHGIIYNNNLIDGKASITSRSGFSITESYILVTKYKAGNPSGTRYFDMFINNERNKIHIGIRATHEYWSDKLILYVGNANCGSCDEDYGSWFIRKTGYSESCNNKVFTKYEDGTGVIESSSSPSSTTETKVFIELDVFNTSTNYAYLDWVCFGKYVCNISSSVGEEEIPAIKYSVSDSVSISEVVESELIIYKISGKVILPDGSGYGGAKVLIIREDTYEIVKEATSDSNGNYEVEHLKDDVTYTVIAIPPDSDKNGSIKCHISPVSSE